jgi:SAM-dependent methyltransferase
MQTILDKQLQQRHRVQFPRQDAAAMDSDEVFFYVVEDDERVRVRFHDYADIYSRPGLYEQLFYDRLKCSSPRTVGERLQQSVERANQPLSELRVLDLGAGNGMMGEVLKQFGVARMVGVDIIPEACEATDRDRPGIYDAYYITDFCDLDPDEKLEFAEWSFDCLTCVAALGFGDIPPAAFFQALQFLAVDGWVAFNIKETFLDHSDKSGFSRLIRELIFSEFLDVHHMERYRHRLSIDGQPLFYFSLVARLNSEIPLAFATEHNIDL